MPAKNSRANKALVSFAASVVSTLLLALLRKFLPRD